MGLLLLLLLALAGCQHPSSSTTPRIAVLRFENLTPDPSLDWMGRALSEALITQSRAVPGAYTIPGSNLRAALAVLGPRPATAPGISSERGAALFSGATRIVTGQYAVRNAQLHVYAQVEDVAAGRTVEQAEVQGPASAGVLPLTASLARRLAGSAAAPLGTASPEALQAYATAVDESDYTAASRAYAAAALADPNFGLVYPSWAAGALAHQDAAGARRAVELGLARASALVPLDRARLQLLDASLRNDVQGRLQALATLQRLTPQDPTVFRTAAGIALAHRDYPAAIRGLRRAIQLEPANIQDLNQLAYAEAYTGDLAAATATLRRYQALRPRDPNPLDSLGDVNLYNGQYAAAEKFYLASHRAGPAFLGGGSLLKAAWARLLDGDIAGADTLFDQLSAQLKASNDSLLPYRQADWAWITGRRRQAVSQLDQFASSAASGPLREMASRAYAQLAFWNLELDDRDAARSYADRALSSATPGSSPVAALARTLSEPPASPAEWRQRISRLPAPLQQLSLAYALLFAQDFRDAVPVLQSLYQASRPEDEQGLPVLLAWAQIASGNWQAAAPLVAHTPIPQTTGIDPFTSLWFPRLFYVRAQLLQQQGRTPDAQKYLDLFHKLSAS